VRSGWVPEGGFEAVGCGVYGGALGGGGGRGAEDDVQGDAVATLTLVQPFGGTSTAAHTNGVPGAAASPSAPSSPAGGAWRTYNNPLSAFEDDRGGAKQPLPGWPAHDAGGGRLPAALDAASVGAGGVISGRSTAAAPRMRHNPVADPQPGRRTGWDLEVGAALMPPQPAMSAEKALRRAVGGGCQVGLGALLFVSCCAAAKRCDPQPGCTPWDHTPHQPCHAFGFLVGLHQHDNSRAEHVAGSVMGLLRSHATTYTPAVSTHGSLRTSPPLLQASRARAARWLRRHAPLDPNDPRNAQLLELLRAQEAGVAGGGEVGAGSCLSGGAGGLCSRSRCSLQPRLAQPPMPAAAPINPFTHQNLCTDPTLCIPSLQGPPDLFRPGLLPDLAMTSDRPCDQRAAFLRRRWEAGAFRQTDGARGGAARLRGRAACTVCGPGWGSERGHAPSLTSLPSLAQSNFLGRRARTLQLHSTDAYASTVQTAAHLWTSGLAPRPSRLPRPRLAFFWSQAAPAGWWRRFPPGTP
jgi:hypothetical protein